MLPKVLIFEDNEVIAEQLRYFLERYDYKCKVFESGEEGLAEVEAYNPDIVLMDIRLAGAINGIETARRMKKIGDYPVIFLTSHIEPDVIEQAATTDPAGFASKSISHSELKVQIDYNLIKHQRNKEQKKQLKELGDSTKKYEAMFNSSRDAIFFVDSDGIISFWNPSAERIFGIPHDDAINKNIRDLIIPEENRSDFSLDFKQWMKNPNDNIGHKTLHINCVRNFGKRFPAELTLGIVDYNGAKAVCGFARDITEKVIAEEEISKLIEEMQVSKEVIEQNASELVILNSKLIESEEQLKELNASKDKFFSIIAHDLKGPFQGLIGYSTILSSDINSLTQEEVHELAQSLNQSATQLFKLLENLLSWSRIQRGVIECNPIDFQLSLLTRQNIDLIKSRADQKEINVKFDIPDDITLFADVNMVNTILRNLLSNAVKFTHRGGTITLSATKKSSDRVEINIKDSGVGMSNEVQKNVFRIDTYHTTPGTENELGTGLGLVLCKDLVHKNDGEIYVESVLGEGSVFSVILPAGLPSKSMHNQ